MQIYEYTACYFVGFSLALLTLYVSGVKKKAAFYFFAVNSLCGFLSSLVFIALQTVDSLLIAAGGFFGIAGQAALSFLRLLGQWVL